MTVGQLKKFFEEIPKEHDDENVEILVFNYEKNRLNEWLGLKGVALVDVDTILHQNLEDGSYCLFIQGGKQERKTKLAKKRGK